MADKRPKEEQNEKEKESSKKEKESHAELLKKGIAERVQKFLATADGKKAMERGKDFFVEQFLKSWDASDADALAAYKALIGKKEGDELTLKDLADIRITYEDTLDSYLQDAERTQFTEVQEKAVAHTFLDKMQKEIEGKHFSQQVRDAWNQYVSSKKNTISSRDNLQDRLKEFFLKAGLIITPEQKKRLQKVSVDLREVASYMTEKGGFEKEAADNLNKKEIISANTDVEDMVKRFLRTYAQTELAPTYDRFHKNAQEIAAIYKVPGFQGVLEGFDLSAETLAKNDKSFAEVYNDASANDEKKFNAQKKAIVRAIASKDAPLSELIDALFENQFNLSKLNASQQQVYVDRFQELWSNSKEMKMFDELFTKIGADVSDRKDLMKQIFDLSKKEIQVKGKNGQTYTISLQKKIIDRPWSGETMSETLAHEMPIAFLLSPDQNVDASYLQELTKVTEKGFVLKDENGKDIQLYPGHLVEITTKDGKKHTGYIYKDPEGNVLLSKQPGSADRVNISADEVKSSSTKILEQTYSLKPEDIPTLLAHIALMRETAERTDEENREVRQEKNEEIAQEVIKDKYEAPQPVQEPVTDEAINEVDWQDQEALAAIDAEKRDEMKKHMEKRMKEISKRIDKIEKGIKDQDQIIQSLNQELKVANAKKPLNQEQLSMLQANLQKAKDERDRLMDEKNELHDKLKKYQSAQEKLQQVNNIQKQKDKILPEVKPDVPYEGRDAEEEFAHAWTELNGDKTLTEPEKGKTCLMILLPDASSAVGGGGGAWVRGDVIGYDAKTQTMEIKWHGIESPIKGVEGQISVIEGAEGLMELKRTVSKVYKFKKYNTITQWGIDLKGGVSAADDNHAPDSHFHFDKKYEGRWKHLKDDIDFSSMIHQQTKKPIKYFGKKVGNERVRYEIDQGGGSVKVKELKLEDVKDADGKPTSKELKVTYKREMPINDFMMFAMEKDLRGYTQEDVDDANGGNEDASNKGNTFIYDRVEPAPQGIERMGGGLFGMRWGNIAGVMSSWDMVKKGVKNYFEEKTKKGKSAVENAMLTSKWFKGLEKLPILGGAFDDIRGGIESKLDTEKKKKINDYKDEVGTKKDTSSSGGSDFIKNALTEKEAKKDPLKAAGYYLYALEQGNPYFRSLKDFKETGWWVGRILGEKYRVQYLAYIKNIENELKKNPNSKELNNDLSMGELGFMQKVFNEGKDTGVQDELKAMVGNWFFTGGLGQFQYGTGWYNSSKIEEVVKSEGMKPFHQLYGDSWTGWYEASRVNDVLGVLKLMSEKVGSNEDYYYKWAGSMLMPLMNGLYRTDMAPSYKSIYQGIARKNAFPFAAYMTEGNATEKVQELMDIFAEGSLTEAFEKESTTDKDGKPLSQLAIRTSAFKKWWDAGHGRKALDLLQNPKELFAKKKQLESQTNDQKKLNQYNTLSDYIKNKYNDEDRNSISEQIDGESIIYQKNIFSAPSGFVKEQMLNFSNGQFKGRSEKNGPELWEALKAKLNDINNISEADMTPDFFAFILKRYFTMFHTKYNSTGKRAFIGALKYPSIMPEIFRLNVRRAFDKKLGGNDLPAEVEDTLVLFESIFKKFAPLVKKNPEIIEEVFEDARMLDYYYEMTPDHLQQTAQNMKALDAQLKQAISLGQVDEDGFDYDQAA